MPSPPRSPLETTRDREIAEMLLPPMRRRLHDILLFLAIFQSLYAVALVIAPDALWRIRLALNLSRLLVLFGSVGLLRRPGSDRQTLVIAATAIATQLFVGGALSVVRGDAMPTAILAVALNAVTSAILPWNARTQFAIAAATVAGLHVTSHFVQAAGGIPLSFDSMVTVWATLGFTVWLSRLLERTRSTLSARLDEARRTDEELAALHRDLERRVAERTAELEMANRELEGFSYTVSHDLRSPLRTISGFSQMILDESGGRLDETAREHLSKIRAASRRMDDLIDDMLLLARVGRTALRYETVEVAKLAASIGAQLAAEEPDRRVEFTVGGIPPVPADHGLLKIALDNLLRNAWKFTSGREAARVTVSGERRDDRVVIRVEDNGVGFDPRFRHKLFLPFQRLHDHEDFPGTGVGLATVARIVRRHGGEVDADSDGESGAVFTIALPAKRPSQGAYFAASTSSTEATTAAVTVATCSSARS